MFRRYGVPIMALVAVLLAAGAFAQQQQQPSMFGISGVTYTKWLWGNQHYDGSLYNFTTVPGEGYGDNGQGTELELLVSGKPNRYLEVSGRIHSRFSQNFWTNFGGFGNPAGKPGGDGACVGGDCGEADARSNQYVKLRGMTIRVTPGFSHLDAIQFGSTDLGMFDPFTMGKIRYIDRDNLGALIAQGPIAPGLRYDVIRISMPRLWAGPGFNTGSYTSQDAAYGLQFRWTGSQMFDATLVAESARDLELDATDRNVDNGRQLSDRYKNDVFGVRFGIHPSSVFDIRGNYYHSSSDPNTAITGEKSLGISAFSPVPAAKFTDNAWKLDLDINDPFNAGLSFNVEAFDIGSDYVSILAARRESDVLLTEGHDGAFAFPGPSNASYGVFGGNPTRIGYAGWQGNMQQVATINVDNEFTDFDEPAAETVIGWKGITLVPKWQKGPLELAGELTHIGYNTNWQAWGDASKAIGNTPYPTFESDTGVGHNFRTAYSPFQDKKTNIGLVRGKYTANIGKGVDFLGKIKFIKETDKRLNDARFLPFQTGDCPGNGQPCKNSKNFYSSGNSTADIYGNPPVITVNGVTGYQWKPFDNIADDDRDLKYNMVQLGAGYQLTDVIYGTLMFEKYRADLQDGNTAFQAYQLHEMASGKHDKNKIIVLLKYPIGGAEAGFDYEYAFGTFKPDFGGGFVPQIATDDISKSNSVPVASLGFAGRFGGWNSLEKRDFKQNHLKAYFKVRF
ncbi:MAG TPA: hypothetical protein VLV78_21255 [Thermoanaerobaculia bacterium]|nr:hypothetical protein [Thermoanaerobaculia bacterium]